MKNLKVSLNEKRKADHIEICLTRDVCSGINNGLSEIFFIHNALPEINFEDINLKVKIFNKKLKGPILISSMTGGNRNYSCFNEVFARAAQETGIALALGSQRVAIEDSSLVSSFQVRKFAPDILLFANIGAIQLNYGFGLETCKKVIGMAEADALILHLNPLQEVLQPEGNTNFANLLNKIELICKNIEVPIVVKEVGWGISGTVAKLLRDVGVSAIDVAGAGGTSFSQIEMYRNSDPMKAQIAASFRDWGIPTRISIQETLENVPDVPIFASGGLLNGIDIAKCLALGAKLGGMAKIFLQAAELDLDSLIQQVNKILNEIKICLFLTGKKDLNEFDCSVLRFEK